MEGRTGEGSVLWGRVRACGRPAFFAEVLEDISSSACEVLSFKMGLFPSNMDYKVKEKHVAGAIRASQAMEP